MDIHHKQMDTNGSFYVEQNTKKVALMTYSINAAGTMLIDHTEFDPALQGENIGIQLVNAAVVHARDNKLKIEPLCSFVSSVVSKDKNKYADILL